MKLRELKSTDPRAPTLLSYMGPTTASLHSTSLLCQPQDRLQRAVAWRSNTTFHGKPCLCSHPFRRSHLSCLLSENCAYQEILSSPAYQCALAKYPVNNNFTVLDYLLNTLEFDLFDQLYLAVHSLLSSPLST